MNFIVVLFFSIIFIIYGLLNYYIGFRAWQLLSGLVPFLNLKVYWLFFWFISFSYIIGRLVRRYFSYSVGNMLTIIGSYWLAIMFYSILVLAFIDLIRLFDKWFDFIPQNIKHNQNITQVIGIAVIAFIVGVVIYGIWNARNPEIVHYDISVPKYAKDLKSLRIVALSDIHVGVIVNDKRISKAVDIINKLNPDLVLFIGDTIDEDIDIFKEKNMVDIFGSIKSKYGNFAVLGNHEYIGGRPEEAIYYIEKSGIKVLRDTYVKVNDSFYIVGRDDKMSERFVGKPRKNLDSLLKDIDTSLPIILLDHQPVNLSEPQQHRVDLQLSGHTHKGQMFPNQFVTSKVFENDWGHLVKDNFHVIVSSGFGTWGPPIRIGNNPEIVDIIVNFK